MTHAEQHQLIMELREYVRKMNRYEQEEFEMFAKRDKDDEDLDGISQRRLAHLHTQYVVRKRRMQ